jgi:tRNA/rRNA methyltransferase
MSSAPDIRFVLFEPTHPGNIGSVARAIKTMGFDQLWLVNPPPEHICSDSRAMASGAQDVLHGARGCGQPARGAGGLWSGAGCECPPPAHRLPGDGPARGRAAGHGKRASKPVALVFGPERSGLANEQLDLCSAIVYIPANPGLQLAESCPGRADHRL